MACGLGHHIRQGGLFFFLGFGFFAVFWAGVVIGDGHALHLRQLFDGFNKAQAGVLHQEAQRVAVHTATKAVIGLAAGADDEAGRLFAVEGAQTFEVDARFFERDMAPDDIDDVGSSQ
ncbi:MAG: hypothetical protein RLZZ369_1212 [Pseudomonadota bacterium]